MLFRSFVSEKVHRDGSFHLPQIQGPPGGPPPAAIMSVDGRFTSTTTATGTVTVTGYHDPHSGADCSATLTFTVART